MRFRSRLAALCFALVLAGCATGPGPQTGSAKLQKINHVVVIYAENHIFDNMFGMFPGANGVANAKPENYVQRDHDGSVLPELVVFGRDGKPDPAFPRFHPRPARRLPQHPPAERL